MEKNVTGFLNMFNSEKKIKRSSSLRKKNTMQMYTFVFSRYWGTRQYFQHGVMYLSVKTDIENMT